VNGYSKGTITRTIGTTQSIVESLKDDISLGLRPLGKSLGTFFGGLSVAGDENLSQSIRNQGAFDAGANSLSVPAAGLAVGSPLMRFGGANFASESKLISHFEKHGAEFGALSASEYLQVGREIMQNGQMVEYFYKAAGETRTGYVQFMGNNSRGQAKFGFVGTNNDGAITTIHVESGKDIWKTINGNAQDKTIRPSR